METWIRKKQYENREEYIIRIYRAKFNDELDMTNQEIGKLLNTELEEDLEESVRRKKAKLILDSNYTDAMTKLFGDSEKLLSEIKAEKKRLYKQKQKFRDERNAVRRNMRNESRIEAMMEEFMYASDNIRENNRFILPEAKINKTNSTNGVLLFSDLHYGAIFENYWNTYSPDIAVELVNELADKVISKCNMMNVENLLVANMGDNIENSLHVTARIESNADTVEQLMEVSELIANFLYKLTQYVNVKYISTTDNHSRYNKKYKEHIEKENFYRLIDWHIINSFKNSDSERFEVVNSQNFDDTIGYVNFDDKDIFILHGHLDKPKSVFENIIGMTGIIPDRIYLGHYHEKFELDKFGTRILVNGSLKGVDSYAKDKRLGNYKGVRKQIMEIFDTEADDDIIVDLKF